MNPLERAADLIEERGWCRGRFRDEAGRMCIDFAMVSADLTTNALARRCVLDELRGRGVRCNDLALWNDFQAVDSHEVVDLLRNAAKRWKAKANPAVTV